MPVKKVKEYLDKNNVKYIIISHSPAYSAMEIAASAHIPGKDLAKVVMVKIDGKISMFVLPAAYKVDFNLLKKGINANAIELATEDEFVDMFPDCELGAMTPFGNLYNMEVYVAEKLTLDEEIAFNAGSHSELFKMYYKDFERLVKPKILKFAS